MRDYATDRFGDGSSLDSFTMEMFARRTSRLDVERSRWCWTRVVIDGNVCKTNLAS
jgi:hypothetical protein